MEKYSFIITGEAAEWYHYGQRETDNIDLAIIGTGHFCFDSYVQWAPVNVINWLMRSNLFRLASPKLLYHTL
jgi:hypothetical protein